MYLVDTSVWIDFLRNKSNERITLLDSLLEDGSAYICEIIFIEVLSGAKDAAQFKKYETYFGQLPFLRLGPAWEKRVSQMIFEAKNAGKSVFVADTIIAHLAIENNLVLLTSDKDFAAFHHLHDLKIQ